MITFDTNIGIFYICKKSTMHPSDIIGSIAAIALWSSGTCPRPCVPFAPRSTDDIATGTFLMMRGSARPASPAQGILTGNIPLFVTNLLTTIIVRSSSGSRSTTAYFKDGSPNRTTSMKPDFDRIIRPANAVSTTTGVFGNELLPVGGGHGLRNARFHRTTPSGQLDRAGLYA